jgi:hypothetical protein
METSGFVWGYFLPILRITGFAPYDLPPRKNVDSLKWKICTFLNIVLHIVLMWSNDSHHQFLDMPENSFFGTLFNEFNVRACYLAIVYALMIVYKRRFKILAIICEISSLGKDMAWDMNLFTKGNSSISLLFYYFIILNAGNAVQIAASIFLNFLDFGFISKLLILKNANFISDLNFIIFVLNVNILFEHLKGNVYCLRNQSKRDLLIMIKRWKNFYFAICKIAEEVEDCFKDSIVVVLTVEFAVFVYVNYLMIVKGIYWIYILAGMEWNCFYASKIIVKLYMCYSVVKKVI